MVGLDWPNGLQFECFVAWPSIVRGPFCLKKAPFSIKRPNLDKKGLTE